MIPCGGVRLVLYCCGARCQHNSHVQFRRDASFGAWGISNSSDLWFMLFRPFSFLMMFQSPTCWQTDNNSNNNTLQLIKTWQPKTMTIWRICTYYFFHVTFLGRFSSNFSFETIWPWKKILNLCRMDAKTRCKYKLFGWLGRSCLRRN